ncbi:hypothetical protein ACROYT_G032588 [Oculina patagonica]
MRASEPSPPPNQQWKHQRTSAKFELPSRVEPTKEIELKNGKSFPATLDPSQTKLSQTLSRYLQINGTYTVNKCNSSDPFGIPGLSGTWEVEAELILVASKDGCEAEERLTTTRDNTLTADDTRTGAETEAGGI